LGIKLALHPMADLATEPRWFRNFNTFGEDAELSSKMVKEHILGFQGEELGTESVLCQVKHFPGGGPQKDGMDAHFASGKEQNYRGGNFAYHLSVLCCSLLISTFQHSRLYLLMSFKYFVLCFRVELQLSQTFQQCEQPCG
jgi:beta-glucosidase